METTRARNVKSMQDSQVSPNRIPNMMSYETRLGPLTRKTETERHMH
jgi:hypothetical protein